MSPFTSYLHGVVVLQQLECQVQCSCMHLEFPGSHNQIVYWWEIYLVYLIQLVKASCMAAVVGRHDCRVVCKCGGWQAGKPSGDGGGACNWLVCVTLLQLVKASCMAAVVGRHDCRVLCKCART